MFRDSVQFYTVDMPASHTYNGEAWKFTLHQTTPTHIRANIFRIRMFQPTKHIFLY